MAQRRDEIVAAAQRLFGTRPAEEVSIDEIAAEAGVSRALVYRYFGGKHALYLHALIAAVDDLARRVDPAPGPALSRLRVAVAGYLDFAEQHAHGFVTLLRGSTGNAEAAEIINRTRGLIAELVFDGLALDRSSPRLRATLAGWIAAAEAMTLDWLENRELSRAEIELLLIEHLLAVLAALATADPALRSALTAAVAEAADLPPWVDHLAALPATH